MTSIILKIEVDLDVPLNVFGMWITHQLNYGPRGPFPEQTPEVEAHLDSLDSYKGIVLVNWTEPIQQWTKNPPSENGLYCLKMDGGKPSVVNVYHCHKKDKDFGPMVSLIGTDSVPSDDVASIVEQIKSIPVQLKL